MLEVEEVLRNLVECNTIADKENKKIMDYIENTLCPLRFSNRKKREVFDYVQ